MRPGLLVCSRRIVREIAIETHADVDASLIAERRDRGAGPRIDRRQRSGVQIQQPAIGPIAALPVVDAAIADRALVGVRPLLLPGQRVERHDRVVLRQHEHRAVDDDRVEAIAPGVGGRIAPRDVQARHRRLVDLVERGILRRVGAAEILRPGLERSPDAGWFALEQRGDGPDQHEDGDDQRQAFRHGAPHFAVARDVAEHTAEPWNRWRSCDG